MKTAKFLTVVIFLFFLLPNNGFGQQEKEESKWGVNFQFDPRWKVPSGLKELFDAKSMEIEGREFRVGIVRGRTLSGDWGVSFVQKQFSSNSFIARGVLVPTPGGQPTFVDTLYLRDASFAGVEIHKYLPFTTIKERVQVGINIAGGVAGVKGTLERHLEYDRLVWSEEVPPKLLGLERVKEIQQIDAKRMFKKEMSVIPLFKLQGVVAFIPAPGFKIKVASGLNFPGYQIVEASFLYFFGSK